MDKEVRILAVVYAVLGLGGISNGADPNLLDKTLNAICQVESSGGKDMRDGDNGKAIGPFQIHRSYWQDGTRFLGVDWPYSDARNQDKARQVVRAYLMHYAPKGTPEVWAKMHNGGPRGHKKAATIPYWNKVRKFL